MTFLLQSCADYIRPHEESICKSIVKLLVTCSDSVSIRKVTILLLILLIVLDPFYVEELSRLICWMQELLVALKHVLGTDCKRGLFPLIDTLLEER